VKYAATIEYLQDPEIVGSIRPAHRQYLASLMAAGQLAASGPVADMSGALIIYESDSAEAAEAMLKADPFHTAGVFLTWTIRPWKVVISSPTLMATV